eukprot:2227126-Pleurochrysis_carterae.AAC.2
MNTATAGPSTKTMTHSLSRFHAEVDRSARRANTRRQRKKLTHTQPTKKLIPDFAERKRLREFKSVCVKEREMGVREMGGRERKGGKEGEGD